MIAPPWIWPRAAYVHIPFCAHHCGYCDFAIAVGRDDRIGTYLDALEAELRQLGEPQPVDTLFLGGGTPTHLRSSQLERLLRLVTHWFPLQPGHEFSIEANPNDITRDVVALLVANGVNRLSLGAQSFDPEMLRRLDRQHHPDDVPRAVELARPWITSISLDLIFGVPGQTLELWQRDLEQALRLRPDHLSTYGLTFEKGTPLWKSRQQGLVQAVDEETELALYLHTIDTLETTGFEHYEISSFARPGHRCRHNQVYWANHAYFGVGMGAARYVAGRRSVNTRDLTAYIRKALAGEPLAFQSEQLGPKDRALETIGLNLRRREGVKRTTFRDQTGFDLEELAGAVVSRQVQIGLMEDDGKRVYLTRRGKCVADVVIEQFWRR